MILWRRSIGQLALCGAGASWTLVWRDREIARGVFVSPIDWAKSIAWRAGFRPHWVKWIR